MNTMSTTSYKKIKWNLEITLFFVLFSVCEHSSWTKRILLACLYKYPFTLLYYILSASITVDISFSLWSDSTNLLTANYFVCSWIDISSDVHDPCFIIVFIWMFFIV